MGGAMTDAFVAALAGVSAAVLVRESRRRIRAGRSEKLLNRLALANDKAPAEKVVLLHGLAARVSATRWGERVKAHAERSHPSVSFSDYIAFALVSSLAAGLGVAILTGRPSAALICAAVAPLAVDWIATRMHGSRSARVEKQLPTALNLQAGALRAGQSLVKSLRIVAEEVKPPLGEDLDRMVREIDLGRPVEDALEGLSARIGSRDLDLWITSMLVHRQTGGNLAGLIDALAGQVTERIHLRREIKAMTAQGRMSGLVVALAPLTFFSLLSVGSREQMEFLYSTPVGWALLATGLTMNGLGFLWIRATLRIRS